MSAFVNAHILVSASVCFVPESQYFFAEIFSHQIGNPFSQVQKFSTEHSPSLPPQQHYRISSTCTEKTLIT